jgi:hypothetical protein
MPKVLSIPTDQLVAFTVLRDLGPEGIDRMTQAIQSQKVLLHVHELQRAIFPVVNQNARVVGEVLTGLSLLRRGGRQPEQVVDDLTETLHTRSDELDPAWSPADFEHWSKLRGSLITLLATEPLLTVGKALNLQFAHANILRDCQVVTDVRPVFDSTGEKPLATVISHTLCLRYLDDGKPERLSVALDHHDLTELMQACERAVKKENSLKAMLSDLLRTEIAGYDGESEAADGTG